jgi:hypothetical protein
VRVNVPPDRPAGVEGRRFPACGRAGGPGTKGGVTCRGSVPGQGFLRGLDYRDLMNGLPSGMRLAPVALCTTLAKMYMPMAMKRNMVPMPT